MEASRLRLCLGEVECLRDLHLYVEASDDFPVVTASPEVCRLLVEIVIREGRRLKDVHQTMVFRAHLGETDQLGNWETMLPAMDIYTAIRVLIRLSLRDGPICSDVTDALGAPGLVAWSEANMDCYFTWPEECWHYVRRFILAVCEALHCQAGDLLRSPHNVARIVGAPTRCTTGSDSGGESNPSAVHIPGVHSSLSEPAPGRRYRSLPKEPAYVPFKMNPLSKVDEADALYAPQFPMPITQFAHCFGLGCVPRLPHAALFHNREMSDTPLPSGCDVPRRANTPLTATSRAAVVQEGSPRRDCPSANAGLSSTAGLDAAHSLTNLPMYAMRVESERNQRALHCKLLRLYLQRGKLLGWGSTDFHALGTASRGDVMSICTPSLRDGEGCVGGRDGRSRYYPEQVCSPDVVVQVACGSHSTYVLTLGGQVFSCGRADMGQLGAGGGALRHAKEGVASYQRVLLKEGDQVLRIVSGMATSLAITSKTHVYVWGHNGFGQCLQDVTCGLILNPVRSQLDGHSIASVALGKLFGVVAFADGSVCTWGSTDMIGSDIPTADDLSSSSPCNSRSVRQLSPLSMPSNVPIKAVYAGAAHALAITTLGGVYTWGSGRHGRLGHGDENDEETPRLVEGLRGECVVSASCGAMHSAVVTVAGSLYAFGANAQGELGLPGRAAYRIPTRLRLPERVIAVSCGLEHTLVLLADGDVMACGTLSQCGLGFGECSRLHIARRVLQNYVTLSVTAGPAHSFATVVKRSTALLRIGNSRAEALSRMDGFLGPHGIRSVGVGEGFIVVVSERGNAMSMGRGERGQLGIGEDVQSGRLDEKTELSTFAPIGLPPDVRLQTVSCGPDYVFAISDGAIVLAWGSNAHGQQCVSPEVLQAVYLPTAVEAYRSSRVVQIACGDTFVVALTEEGKVFTHGEHAFCGRGPPAVARAEKTPAWVPGQVLTLSEIVSVAAGRHHSVAQGANGVLYTWGCGVLGDGANASIAYTPVTVVLFSVIRQIGCGPCNSFAIDEGGDLYVWGSNQYQQCGVPHGEDEPVHAITIPRVVARDVRGAAFSVCFSVVLLHGGHLRVAGHLRHNDHEFNIPTHHTEPQPTFSVDTILSAGRHVSHKDVPRRLTPYEGLEPQKGNGLECQPCGPEVNLAVSSRLASREASYTPPSSSQEALRSGTPFPLFGLRCFGGWDQVYAMVEKHRPTMEEVQLARRGLEVALHQPTKPTV